MFYRTSLGTTRIAPEMANRMADKIATEKGAGVICYTPTRSNYPKMRASRKAGWLRFTNTTGIAIIVEPTDPNYQKLNAFFVRPQGE